MTKKRARELKVIAAHIYADVLDIMGTHKHGHVKGGAEETIVMVELVKKMMLDVVDWSIEDNLDEEKKD